MDEYKIGQRFWIKSLDTDGEPLRVTITALYPFCIITEDSRGVRHGFNRQSAFMDLFTKKPVINNKGVEVDKDKIRKLAEYGYTPTQIADELRCSLGYASNIVNTMKKEGLLK